VRNFGFSIPSSTEIIALGEKHDLAQSACIRLLYDNLTEELNSDQTISILGAIPYNKNNFSVKYIT